MKTLEIGIALNNLRLGLREGCRKAAEIGVDSVQLHFRDNDVDLLALDSAHRRDEALRVRDLGLGISAVCALSEGKDFESAENMDRALFSWLGLARDLGAPVVLSRFIGVIPGGGTSPFGPIPPPPFAVVAAMRPAVLAAANEGIVFAHETGLENPADVAAFINAFESPGVGVNYDPANLCAFGYDWLGGVEIIGRRIVHVHAKDARRYPDGGFEETRLGEGQVDYTLFLQALRRTGFNGCLALERESGTDPVGEMKAAVAFLRDKIREIEKPEGGNGNDR
jgi:L-ribulose-5-phosphate 3-epimerase